MNLSTLLRSLISRFCRIHAAEPGEGDPDTPETPQAGDDTGEPEGGAGDDNQPNTPANKGAPPDERDRLIKKLERRIDNRTRGLGQRDQTIAELQAEVARLKRGGAMPQPEAGDDDDNQPARTPQRRTSASNEEDLVPASEVPRLVRSQVEEARFRERIASSTTKMLEAGKVYEGFRELVLDVAEDIPLVDRNGRPTHFAEALLDCDVPADVVVHIQRNDELRDKLAAIADNPRLLARQLALVEADVRKKPPTRSKAATPLEPNKGGSGSGPKSESEMTDAEWAANREAQRKKRA